MRQVRMPRPHPAGAVTRVGDAAWGASSAERTAPEMAWVEDWTIAAGCRGMDPDELFVQGAAQNRAKVVCATCPVRTECLADALDNRVEYGVWGGMTERERRALLRRRPEVRSWRQVLEEKRDAYLERTGGMLIMPAPAPLLPGRGESGTAEVLREPVLAEAQPVAAG